MKPVRCRRMSIALMAFTGWIGLHAQDSESKMPKDMVRSNSQQIPGKGLGVPRATSVRAELPDAAFWQKRDIHHEIRESFFSGALPMIPVHERVTSFQDFMKFASGWQVYGFALPAQGRIQWTLHQPREGWFRFLVVDSDGVVLSGQIGATTPGSRPTAGFTNEKSKPVVAYLLVDDPGRASTVVTPFEVTVSRSWEVGKADLSGARFSRGVWGAIPGIAENSMAPKPDANPH